MHRGVVEHNEPGLLVVFETSPDKLVRDAAGFGWDFEDLERRNKLKIVFTSPAVLDAELRSLHRLIDDAMPCAHVVHSEKFLRRDASCRRTLCY